MTAALLILATVLWAVVPGAAPAVVALATAAIVAAVAQEARTERRRARAARAHFDGVLRDSRLGVVSSHRDNGDGR